MMGSEFLRGNSTTDECEGLFKQYKDCLTVSIPGPTAFVTNTNLMQKALKERGIDSMLEEARDSNQDTDAENMRRSCEFCCYRPLIQYAEPATNQDQSTMSMSR